MSRQHSHKRNGLKLPFTLQKELGLQDARDTGRGRRRHGGSMVADRKQRRKDMRNVNKRGTMQRNPEQIQESDFETETETETDDIGTQDLPAPSAIAKFSKPDRSRELVEVSHKKEPKLISEKTRRKSSSPNTSESDGSRASSPGLVLDANSKSFKQHAAEDDAEIAALERRLGMKGKKTRLGDNMLDYVLDGLEEESDNKKRKREGQDWLDQKRRRVTVLHEADSESDGDEIDLGDEDTSDLDGLDDGGGEEDFSDLLDPHSRNLEDSEGELEDELSVEDEGATASDVFTGFDSDQGPGEPAPARRIRENPYVAPVAPGSTSTKYVPPSLRKRAEGEDSGLITLKRQLQGHLNKLSEANMISVLGEIEKLYRLNARQDVTMVLIDIILTSFCVRASLQNTFIILHAAFLAAIYKVMGTEFGAELLVRLVQRFDKEHAEGTGKEDLNLLSLLANLFTFNVVSSNIVYDHIGILLSDFTEANAELLLRIIRDCGPQLRSDDSAALKGIVQTMQETSTDMAKKGQNINIRTKVMMDTITDLKNNKMKNATNAAGVTGEHITRMRKALGSLNNRALKATEPLRITRDDIANSDKKGKWWLVGASWKGDDSRRKDNDIPIGTDQVNGLDSAAAAASEVDLLALAKQYRMNTDVRRSIFVAIMSASDCRDALNRLLKLRLSKKQEQEFSKVLLRCARAEPAWNPYYALLAKNLCKDNKRIKIGFQFGLWDFFRQMGEKADDQSDEDDEDSTIEMHEIVNVARMYAYLIFRDHLGIGVLKTLNIGFLREQATMFLEILMISIFTQPKADEEALMRVFTKAAEAPQIAKSLQYFMKKNVRKSDLVSKKDKNTVYKGCRIAQLALQVVDSGRIG